MTVSLDPHMMTMSATARLAAGGGGAGGIEVVQLLNPGTSTNVDSLGGLVTNGNKILAVAATRTSGTAVQPLPAALPNETNAWQTIQASERFDTGGTSDGAGIVAYLDLSDVPSYASTDDLYNVGHTIVGLEVSGLDTISASLATNSEQAGSNSPNLASITNGDTYDALLITCIAGNDVETASEVDGTSFYTPSPTIDAANYSAHHAFSSYRSDAFVAVIPPTTDALTLAINDPTTSFQSSGWIMRAFGLTATT